MLLYRVDKPHGIALEIPNCTIRGKCVTFVNNDGQEVWERLTGPHVEFAFTLEAVATLMNASVKDLICELPQPAPVQLT